MRCTGRSSSGSATGPGPSGASRRPRPSLELALLADPLHEPALRSLLRVLAADGRRSAALQRYERARDDLRSAYGTDPDPETRRLYRELLVGSADTAGAAEPGDALPAGAGNLPPAVTSFVGRDREVAQVRRLLQRTQLLTLTGPGGAGKTRLAQEAARLEAAAMPDGAWLVDLVPVRHRHLVADTVAVALGLPPAAGRDPLRALTLQLARRRLLLILDNCEHLLPECARVATTLREHCPGVSVLATSREPLHVDGEVMLRVPSLGLPEPGAEPDPETLAGLASVRLFVERVRDLSPDFTLDRTNAAAVVEICRRLDGMPLALELAAARTAYLEPAEIAERLGDALSVLGRPGTATRHATLRAALEWSHDLLTAEEQCLLRRLAVFEGGCTVVGGGTGLRRGPGPRRRGARRARSAGGQVAGPGGSHHRSLPLPAAGHGPATGGGAPPSWPARPVPCGTRTATSSASSRPSTTWTGRRRRGRSGRSCSTWSAATCGPRWPTRSRPRRTTRWHWRSVSGGSGWRAGTTSRASTGCSARSTRRRTPVSSGPPRCAAWLCWNSGSVTSTGPPNWATGPPACRS